MGLLITGGTGFIGKTLCLELTKAGHELTLVSRHKQKDWGLPSKFLIWDMEKVDCPEPLDSYDGIIHLAGESIAKWPWSARQKQRILDSRILSTQALGRALAKRSKPLSCFISASAIGYYPNAGSTLLEENHPPGHGFLSEVCRKWEAEVQKLPNVEREVRLRFGLVLGPGGGLLSVMKIPSCLGLGAILGSGDEWMSWVHRSDLIGIVDKALADERYRGAINAVAPEPVTQQAFQDALAHLVRKPRFLRVPAFLPKLALGEMAELVLADQRVEAKRLRELGYQFRFSKLNEAFIDALDLQAKPRQPGLYPCHRLEAVQFMPLPIEKLFAFFCDPRNLQRITPPTVSLHVKNMSSPELAEGTIINYQLKVRGLPMRWRTLIERWRDQDMFIDSQERGPYAVWNHTHRFFPVPGGTLMTDTVRYRLPFGLLGDLLGLALVRRDIERIFAFRKQVLGKMFGPH